MHPSPGRYMHSPNFFRRQLFIDLDSSYFHRYRNRGILIIIMKTEIKGPVARFHPVKVIDYFSFFEETELFTFQEQVSIFIFNDPEIYMCAGIEFGKKGWPVKTNGCQRSILWKFFKNRT